MIDSEKCLDAAGLFGVTNNNKLEMGKSVLMPVYVLYVC